MSNQPFINPVPILSCMTGSKGYLQEQIQDHGFQLPTYTNSYTGPDHMKIWESTVMFQNGSRVTIQPLLKSKKESDKVVAYKAVEIGIDYLLHNVVSIPADDTLDREMLTTGKVNVQKFLELAKNSNVSKNSNSIENSIKPTVVDIRVPAYASSKVLNTIKQYQVSTSQGTSASSVSQSSSETIDSYNRGNMNNSTTSSSIKDIVNMNINNNTLNLNEDNLGTYRSDILFNRANDSNMIRSNISVSSIPTSASEMANRNPISDIHDLSINSPISDSNQGYPYMTTNSTTSNSNSNNINTINSNNNNINSNSNNNNININNNQVKSIDMSSSFDSSPYINISNTSNMKTFIDPSIPSITNKNINEYTNKYMYPINTESTRMNENSFSLDANTIFDKNPLSNQTHDINTYKYQTGGNLSVNDASSVIDSTYLSLSQAASKAPTVSTNSTLLSSNVSAYSYGYPYNNNNNNNNIYINNEYTSDMMNYNTNLYDDCNYSNIHDKHFAFYNYNVSKCLLDCMQIDLPRHIKDASSFSKHANTYFLFDSDNELVLFLLAVIYYSSRDSKDQPYFIFVSNEEIDELSDKLSVLFNYPFLTMKTFDKTVSIENELCILITPEAFIPLVMKYSISIVKFIFLYHADILKENKNVEQICNNYNDEHIIFCAASFKRDLTSTSKSPSIAQYYRASLIFPLSDSTFNINNYNIQEWYETTKTQQSDLQNINSNKSNIQQEQEQRTQNLQGVTTMSKSPSPEPLNPLNPPNYNISSYNNSNLNDNYYRSSYPSNLYVSYPPNVSNSKLTYDYYSYPSETIYETSVNRNVINNQNINTYIDKSRFNPQYSNKININ